MRDKVVELMDTDTIRGCIGRAVESAHARTVEVSGKKAFHKARSTNFVTDLAEGIGSFYADHPDVRVLTRSDASNKADFGLNELLYDVTVCRTAVVTSARARKPLSYVAAPLWHVESELAKNSRQALFDFNKLVLGAAPINLFVGPIVHDTESFIDVLRAPALRCKGKVFVALIPRPSEWDGAPPGILCERLK
jgi:hypothetical protein